MISIEWQKTGRSERNAGAWSDRTVRNGGDLHDRGDRNAADRGKRSKYYVLRPVYRTRATIYVPTDNELLCSRMRPVLSEPEIESLLQSAAGESISWIDDPNERKQVFAQILSGGDRRRVLHLIRMLYVRRRELQKNGKHLRIADEQTLRDAEKLLNDEFAHVLHIPQQDVPDYIRSRMEREA